MLETLIIGNGESRKPFNLDLIHMSKIGCNAIFRDYHIPEIVCVDKRMVDEAILSDKSFIIYTRHNWIERYKANTNVKLVPNLPYKELNRADEPFNWGSGPYAVLLGAMKYQLCHLIGFDLHSKNSTVNNIYKDSLNYDPSDKRAVDPSYWIHQIGKIFELFPHVQFKVYNSPEWTLPKNWEYSNVSLDIIDNLFYNK